MVYKLTVTLSGIKGFFRIYYINGSNSLYTFHKQLRADLEFTLDQPILFKGLDAKGNVVGRYALIDLGKGTVDDITIKDSVDSGITDFIYFYDTVAKKSVNITFNGEVEEGVLRGKTILLPTLIESKGPVPLAFENGYVAFEDIKPKDGPGQSKKLGLEDEDDDEYDDEDEDEDDSEDKEDEEFLYDENE